ncbi:MAG TPA: hypothetical protein VFM69_03485, partial [Pricia sp.]|nr:hypothetical protein [Pricia sp.]
MNPSASGWIDKFGSLIMKDAHPYPDFNSLYDSLKKTGFVYGINTAIPNFILPEHALSEDEKAKINLLNALYVTFALEMEDRDFGNFLTSIFRFYQDLKVSNVSFLRKILSGKKTSSQLEKLIDSRV